MVLLAVIAAPIALASSARAETITIVAFGDSLTQGYGLAQDDGFVPQLQVWLDAQGADVHLLNAGVSGDTTRGGLARIDWTLTPEVDALIVTLGGNDMLRGLDPAFARANLAGILDIVTVRGLPVLLVGLKAPGNFGATYQTDFNAVYPDLAAKYGALYFANFLSAVLDPDAPGIADTSLMQADHLHPNVEGVRLIVQSLGPEVLKLAKRAR